MGSAGGGGFGAVCCDKAAAAKITELQINVKHIFRPDSDRRMIFLKTSGFERNEFKVKQTCGGSGLAALRVKRLSGRNGDSRCRKPSKLPQTNEVIDGDGDVVFAPSSSLKSVRSSCW